MERPDGAAGVADTTREPVRQRWLIFAKCKSKSSSGCSCHFLLVLTPGLALLLGQAELRAFLILGRTSEVELAGL